jgi:serine/threonine-protein kinase RsbW
LTIEVRVEVPGSGEFVQVARNVAAAAAARGGCSVDTLADLRLAVDEAATRLIQDFKGSSLVVDVQGSDDGVRVTVAVRTDVDGWPRSDLDATMSWQIIAALVLDAKASITDIGPTISFGCPIQA